MSPFPWFNLPLEIRTLILREVSCDIVTEYMNEVANIINFRQFRMEDEPPPEKLVPYGPHRLSRYTSLILTCRDFHTILSNHVVIDGKTLPRGLLEFQFHLAEEVVLKLAMDSSHLRSHVPEIIATLGNIWVNPLVIENRHVIPRYVERHQSINASEFFLRMEPWLTRHARQVDESSHKTFRICCVSESLEDME
jgi:hypothetical protein